MFLLVTMPLTRLTDYLIARDRRRRQTAGDGDMTARGRLENVHKSFDKVEVLRGIDLAVAEHDVVCLIGASGSGKSTLLRCVNLLEPIDSGRIFVDGDEITASRRRRQPRAARHRHRLPGVQPLPAHERARQRHARAPQGARRRQERGRERGATQLLARFGLSDKADEYPDRLSGGQQQRAAIVRALAMRPQLLLLDEVTSALDPGARRRGARRDPRARRRRHDDGDRDARDELRARDRERGLLPRRPA